MQKKYKDITEYLNSVELNVNGRKASADDTGIFDEAILNKDAITAIIGLKSWIKEYLVERPKRSATGSKSFISLFYGGSSESKSATLGWLANQTGLKIERIDLSKLISRYIGETEKSLENLFDKVKEDNAILFFDEADALLGKRTEIKDSHDRYANLEINYFLLRLEGLAGLKIISTKTKTNIDPAFLRRMQSVVHFPGI